ncbi:MAG: hypothetical protein NTX13_05330 [Acidobacteria bacterium]|nr:hypothetical protein [Acidobacteriota bacterium]
MPRNQRVACLAGWALLGLAGTLSAALLPEGLELHARKSATPLTAPDPALWREYGFQEGESAIYEGRGRPNEKGVTGPVKSFTVSAWRLRDSTAALAVWQILRPADAQPAPDAATKVAARAGAQTLLAYGNYVLRFDGYQPEHDTIHQVILSLPRFENAALPALTRFLPAEARARNSERYITGPVSLEKFAPRVPPSVVAFQFDTEGITGRFTDRDGAVDLVVFSYPNHQIAQMQIAAFQALPGLTASRSGPLIAVVTQAPNPDAAQRVLSQVQYEATVTLNANAAPPPQQNVGELIIAIVKLAGILIGLATLAGLVFAGIRVATGGGFGNIRPREDAVLTLSLDEDGKKRP